MVKFGLGNDIQLYDGQEVANKVIEDLMGQKLIIDKNMNVFMKKGVKIGKIVREDINELACTNTLVIDSMPNMTMTDPLSIYFVEILGRDIHVLDSASNPQTSFSMATVQNTGTQVLVQNRYKGGYRSGITSMTLLDA